MALDRPGDEAPETADDRPKGGWKTDVGRPSLSEVFRSVTIPEGATWLRRLFAFFGPGYLVAVGYMDPGNWATDIAGGAQFGYRLMSVVLLSSLLAMFLQALCAKLGIVTGRDLAQACRDAYPKPVSIALWLSAEVAIVACDVAEVIGAAIALNLLFHLPIVIGVIVTGFDVLLVLALQHKGFRWIETFVVTLIATMMVIFTLELAFARPDWAAVATNLVPHKAIIDNPKMLYIALGILGATVMPHNLYLHSSIVQTRKHGLKLADLKHAVQSALIDSSIALILAFFVNAAILILAAAVFYRSGHHEVDDIQKAYQLLSPLIGPAVATPLFAIALLASGQNSTLTGTMGGQIILEGFTDFRMKPWVRRLVSRSLAIVPAVLVVMLKGEKGTGDLLIFSQVVLSIQLPFAVIPLMQFTGDRTKMGSFTNHPLVSCLGWASAAGIAGLNTFLVWTTFFPLPGM